MYTRILGCTLRESGRLVAQASRNWNLMDASPRLPPGIGEIDRQDGFI